MNVHWFGKVDFPYIANWTIKKSVKKRSGSFHQIFITTIGNDFCMDNFLSQFQEISVEIKLCIDVIHILQKGGFILTKFISNNRSTFKAFSTKNVSPKLPEINLSVDDIPIERGLRILWNPETDTFGRSADVSDFIVSNQNVAPYHLAIFLGNNTKK